MSTRIDILAAKATYEGHVSDHKCSSGDGCKERIRLWLAYMRTARMWGLEAGDADRARQQLQQAS